jgi:6-phosphogluconolactonase
MAIWLAGCGPTNGLPPVSGEFLYVANAGDGTISEFSINTTTGALSNVGSYPTTSAAFGLLSLTVHPTNEFIYATDANGDHLFGYDIGDQKVEDQDYNGKIFMPNTDTPSTATNTAITDDGRFLYGTSSSDRSIQEFSINLVPGTPDAPNEENGLLTSIGTIPTAGAVYGMAFDESGRDAYVVEAPQRVLQYFVEADGHLTPNGSLTLTSPDSGIRRIVTTKPGPSTECAYVEGGSAVYEMAINATGTLSLLGSVALNGVRPNDIAIHPNGKFLYVASTTPSSISLLSVSPTCMLTMKTQLSLPENHAVDFAIEPSGKFAYATNLFLATLDEFSINQISGAISLIGTVDSESPANPTSLPAAIVTTH